MSKHLDKLLEKYGIGSEVFNILLDDYPEHYKKILNGLIDKIDTCYSELDNYRKIHDDINSKIEKSKLKMEQEQKNTSNFILKFDNPEFVKKYEDLTKQLIENSQNIIDIYSPELEKYSKIIELLNEKIKLHNGLMEDIVRDVMAGGENLPHDFTLDTK